MTLRFIFQVLLVCLFTQTISAIGADNETSAEKAGSRIIGRVVDSQKNQMAFATLIIENTSYSTITDANKYFPLAQLIQSPETFKTLPLHTRKAEALSMKSTSEVIKTKYIHQQLQ
ncbi:hypothetical protein [Saccharicrinis aurantiacus]|uniref:hypothetical protein n=1 Tax=Saccharicrinis aurantiacus TaxID=1849719 RepID=UPI0024930D67|nr:hypothetical protein [Saccharicrinis aurantiacus]